jgi:hypothetical protein
MLLQFTQSSQPELDVARLRDQAQRYFDTEIVIEASDASLGTTLSLATPRYGSGRFRLRLRPADTTDFARLDGAEAANQSHGMAALGRRCPWVWEVTAEADSEPALIYFFGAMLASVALGPLLPDDASGLYGVRSARERAAREERTPRATKLD